MFGYGCVVGLMRIVLGLFCSVVLLMMLLVGSGLVVILSGLFVVFGWRFCGSGFLG